MGRRTCSFEYPYCTMDDSIKLVYLPNCIHYSNVWSKRCKRCCWYLNWILHCRYYCKMWCWIFNLQHYSKKNCCTERERWLQPCSVIGWVSFIYTNVCVFVCFGLI